MEEVKFVKYLTCTQCIRRLRHPDKGIRDFIAERLALPRCKGCQALKEAERVRKNES